MNAKTLLDSRKFALLVDNFARAWKKRDLDDDAKASQLQPVIDFLLGQQSESKVFQSKIVQEPKQSPAYEDAPLQPHEVIRSNPFQHVEEQNALIKRTLDYIDECGKRATKSPFSVYFNAGQTWMDIQGLPVIMPSSGLPYAFLENRGLVVPNEFSEGMHYEKTGERYWQVMFAKL